MEFLKDIFADKTFTFAEFKAAVEANDKIKLVNLKAGGYVDKDKFTAKETESTTLKEQLKTANTQIEDFKKLDVEGIKAAAEKYKSDFDASEVKHKEALQAMQFTFALEKALGAAKAKNTKAVKALLEMDNLKMAGDEIIGLKEQITKITTEAPYLFDVEEDDKDPAVKINKAGGGKPGTSKNPWLKDSYNLTEQGRLLRDEPDKAKAYKALAGK